VRLRWQILFGIKGCRNGKRAKMGVKRVQPAHGREGAALKSASLRRDGRGCPELNGKGSIKDNGILDAGELTFGSKD